MRRARATARLSMPQAATRSSGFHVCFSSGVIGRPHVAGVELALPDGGLVVTSRRIGAEALTDAGSEGVWGGLRRMLAPELCVLAHLRCECEVDRTGLAP